MIRLHVSAVLSVCDGYTGRPIAPSAVACSLDGQPYRPEYREGGYLVFVNLEPGLHTLVMRGAYFQPERVLLDIRENDKREYGVTLKPASNYPFGNTATRLLIRVVKKTKPVGNYQVWVAARAAGEEIKLAQDQAEAGSTSIRLFRRGSQPWVSKNFLVGDGKASEVVFLSDIQENQAILAEQLKNVHKRGVALYPAQAYMTNENGECTAIFREPVTVDVFDPQTSKVLNIVLEPGDNTLDIKA